MTLHLLNPLEYGRNLLPSTVGFDRLLSTLSESSNLTEKMATTTYPPYNILKVSEDKYVIELAVAGFKKEEIDITVEENKLVVQGKSKRDEERNKTYYHRGIALRTFSRSFTLADTIVVTGADLVDGLLVVELQNVIPENKKPRKISLSGLQKTLDNK